MAKVTVPRASMLAATSETFSSVLRNRSSDVRCASSARRRSVTSRAPDAPDDLAAEPLRRGEAFDRAAVVQLQHVEALGLRIVVELADPRQERLRVGELVEHHAGRRLVVAGFHELARQAPELEEALVEHRHDAVAVDDDDAVRGRVERRLEERARIAVRRSAHAKVNRPNEFQNQAQARRLVVDHGAA